MTLMREHAIPQDVTGYRFHIVGSMTLKQFAEVALGVVVAIVLYKTNLIPIVKWPLMFLSFAVGAALAWLPIEDRPLDHWFSTFFSILYRPTQFFWRKQVKIPDPFLYKPDPTNEILPDEVDLSPARRQRIQDYLTSVKHIQKADPWETEQHERSQLLLASFDSVQVNSTKISQTIQKPKLQVRVRELQAFTAKALPQFEETISATAPVTGVLTETAANEPTPEQANTAALGAAPDVVANSANSPTFAPNPLVNVGADAQDVANQILVPITHDVDIDTVSKLQTIDDENQTAPPATNVANAAPGPAAPQLISSTPETVFMVNENSALTQGQQANNMVQHSAELPFPNRPTIPNKVVGMVFTPDGKILPGAIVEIRNLKGEVARAVKTNPLGQFFITTPLESGQYVIVADKQGYNFPSQTLTLSGTVLDPLQIMSQA